MLHRLAPAAMPFRASGPGEVNEIDRWEDGVGWIAHPDEGMQRASHALDTDEGVWVIDPVDVAGLDDFLADLGTVAGVVLLLDRHRRHCASVAARHDVPVYVPRPMADVAEDLAADTEILTDALPGTDYTVRTVVDSTLVPVEPFRWRESCLYQAGSGTLVIAESLGTTPYMVVGDERIGVHPMRRMTPPRSLRELAVERILVGHGEGVHEDAQTALRRAIDGARTGAPRLYLKTVRGALAG